MGLQAETEDGNFDFSFNQTAKNFIDAVLQKSKIIGIRGEYTAKYLEYLGYRRNIDFMIIGCPSMYSFGLNLPRISGPEVFRHLSFGIDQRQFHGERFRKVKLGKHAAGVPGIPSSPQAVKHPVIIPDRFQVATSCFSAGYRHDGTEQ